MTLKDIVVQYRKDHDLSQRRFAEMCGLSNGYISMIEREQNPSTGEKITPTLVALKAIATGMGMQVHELLTICDDMPVDLTSPVSKSDLEEDENLRSSLQKLKDRPELRMLLDAADGISAADVQGFSRWLMRMRGIDTPQSEPELSAVKQELIEVISQFTDDTVAQILAIARTIRDGGK